MVEYSNIKQERRGRKEHELYTKNTTATVAAKKPSKDTDQRAGRKEAPPPTTTTATTTTPTTETFKTFEEKPILKSVEKRTNIQVHRKELVRHEEKQKVIEIHEQPIVRKIVHTPIVRPKVLEKECEVEVTCTDERDIYLKTKCQQNLLQQLHDQQQSEIDENTLVIVKEEAPVIQSIQHMQLKEILHRKVITEIHKKPIIEIHEQVIHRIVHEKPVIKTVRCETVYEAETEQHVNTGEFFVGEKEAESSSTTTTTMTTNLIEEEVGTLIGQKLDIFSTAKSMVISSYHLLVPKLFQYMFELPFRLLQDRSPIKKQGTSQNASSAASD